MQNLGLSLEDIFLKLTNHEEPPAEPVDADETEEMAVTPATEAPTTESTEEAGE